MDQDRYIGRLLDNRYEILEVIGTGGMAVVYKARCHRLNRLVAIKILKDEYSRDEEFRRRFHAEGQAVAMLSHPNIVQVYDVSSSDNADFIVMELIDGITLKQYMEKKGVLNWKETLHFAMQIGKALEHAHSRGIVHRDIKPHNVMVLKNGSVKVTDFGIARVVSKSNTLTKEALSSVHYISPEQAKGSRVDNRSDLYSLGIVMYEMMAGRPPYDGESPVAVAIQHINGGAAMPSTLNPNIPGGLEQIIMKAMALDPNDRYTSATVMLYDMDEFRKDPAMLFDYSNTPVDDATRILNSAGAAHTAARQTRTAAERRAGAGGETPHRRTDSRQTGTNRNQQARKRRPEPVEEEDSRSKVATIAVVACSAVAVVAIIIFMIILLNGGFLNQDNDLVTVPNLVGEYYEQIRGMEEFEIVLQSSRYDENVEEGKILEQKPLADEKVRDDKIFVIVSLGPEPEVPTMVDLTNMDAQQAYDFLKERGYAPLLMEENSDEVDEGYVVRTDPAKDAELTEGQVVYLYISTGPEIIEAKVPNVVGMDMETAERLMNNAGFYNLEFNEVESDKAEGEVIYQSEEKNTKIDVTTLIILEVSKGKQIVTARMPYVVGKDRASAEIELGNAGFDLVEIVEVESDAPKGQVVSQSEQENTEVDVMTQIILEVSKGPADVTKTITIDLPTGMTEAYELSLMQDGAEVLTPTTISDLTLTQIEVELTGSGVQYYDLYVNGAYNKTVKVDFTANG